MEVDERISWTQVGLHVLSVFLGFGLALALLGFTGQLSFGKDAPAWVQAIGSVGAILGAIGIAFYERSVARREAVERDRRAADAMFTRGNRAITRFLKVMAPHLALERNVSRGHVEHPLERLAVPDAMLDLEHDCHLMGAAGAAALNAIRCFENAEDLIAHSMLRGIHSKDFFENLDLAEAYCNEASMHFVRYLTRASR